MLPEQQRRRQQWLRARSTAVGPATAADHWRHPEPPLPRCSCLKLAADGRVSPQLGLPLLQRGSRGKTPQAETTPWRELTGQGGSCWPPPRLRLLCCLGWPATDGEGTNMEMQQEGQGRAFLLGMLSLKSRPPFSGEKKIDGLHVR